MKVSTFLSKATEMPKTESLNKLTEKQKETYLKLKEKVVDLNPVELEFSKLFESKHVKGNIAISIDPVDYLLMSVNKSGWDSCYKLTDYSCDSRCFGAYASGTLSYLCDPSTMISYRHSDHKYEYKIGSSKFEEYSKNWRQVIYIDTVTWGFACSRQYPFEDSTLAKNVRELLEETLSNYLDVSNTWKFKEIYDSSKLRKLIIQNQPSLGNRLAYNDIFNNSHGFFVSNPAISKIKDMKLYVDSDPVCPICGELHLDKPNRPVCSVCRIKEGF